MTEAWILRIYLRRRTAARRRSFFQRLWGRSLASELVEDALAGGIPYATVTVGHQGYVVGATRVARADTELELETLPTCVELVGAHGMLSEFLREHAAVLADAVIVWLEGVSVVIGPPAQRTGPGRTASVNLPRKR
jgi:PII-like signaling protein